ncbi:MAG: hypothetical protein Q8P33_02290 [bacterium]|nr:hypothetical protein [bacterium]
MNLLTRSLIITPVLALLLAGCTRGNNSVVFVSQDAGLSFGESNQLDLEDSLAGESILALASHATRPEVFFAGVAERGIIVSRDSAQTWQSTGLNQGSPADLAVHPQATQTLFVASGQNVLRSTDDAATFETLYADPGEVTAVSIDPAAPQNVWVGTDQGSVVLSENAGSSWRVVQNFGQAITDILISPLGSAVIVGTAGDGLHISADRGATFVVRTPELEARGYDSVADEILAIAQSAKVGSPLFVATSAGLFSSNQLGQDWQVLSPPIAEAGTLAGIAADSGDANLVVAVAGNTIATSRDGATTWTTRDAPTERPLGPISIAGQTIVVGVIGEGKGLLERSLQR